MISSQQLPLPTKLVLRSAGRRSIVNASSLLVSLPFSPHVNTPTVSLRFRVFSGPLNGLLSLSPYAPRAGASNRRPTPPLSPHSSWAGLVLHVAQAISTTRTTRLLHTVSTHSTAWFSVFPPATPTRTSILSFVPPPPLLTYLCFSPFFLLSCAFTVVSMLLSVWYLRLCVVCGVVGTGFADKGVMYSRSCIDCNYTGEH